MWCQKYALVVEPVLEAHGGANKIPAVAPVHPLLPPIQTTAQFAFSFHSKQCAAAYYTSGLLGVRDK